MLKTVFPFLMVAILHYVYYHTMQMKLQLVIVYFGGFMARLSDLIITQRKKVIVIFIVAALVSLVLLMFVKINYNMVDYLPPDAQSTAALEIMQEEFTASMPNASVMIKNVSIAEALEYKEKLASVGGVTAVLWLDDIVDIKQPLETGNPATIEKFYKNGHALFSVTIAKGAETEACAAIRRIIGAENALAGEAPDLAAIQEAAITEVLNALAILLPLLILILALSTSSWLEPLIFLATIGIAIMINMGTNLFFGEISFITNSVSPILQLAVSLDYAIFLLHSFGDNRKKYAAVEEAMRHSIKASMPTIAASAATTLFGFVALVFMDFRIGADLGLSLAKGIILSFITVMVFLPALTLSIYKLIDKTRHRALMPAFNNIHKFLSRFAVPVAIMVVIVVVPSYLGQGRTDFIYGYENVNPNSPGGRDSIAIKEEFGQSTIMALLVPRGHIAREQELSRDIEQLDHVIGVMSYATGVGTAIPLEFLDEEITEQFYSDHYARIVVYTDTPEEGEIAFKTVEKIHNIAKTHYGDAFYSAGQSANLYDMKNVIEKDNVMTNAIATIAIFCVLLITFKSATLPLILLITIKAAIWINVAIPYFTGTAISYIGYLVINTVQLGATVDYAIFLTNHYLDNRKALPKGEAMSKSLGETFKSILVSAATLSAAGFTLFVTSSNPVISDLGLLVGRGTLLSMLLVVCFLPAMLTMFDRVIAKTTFRPGFYRAR